MAKQNISDKQKENIRKMLEDQKERSRERLVELGRSSEDADQGFLLGGILGRVGFAIALIVFGGINIFTSVQSLRTLASSPFPIVNLTSLYVIFGIVLGWGVILLAVGILNLIIQHFRMLLVNGIFLIVAGLFSLLGKNFIAGAFQLALGIYFVHRYSNTVKFMRKTEEQRKVREGVAQIPPEVSREIEEYKKARRQESDKL